MKTGTIRVALDATAIGRGKTGNETYLRGLLQGWRQVDPPDVTLLPIFSSPGQPDWSGPSAAMRHGRAGFWRRHLRELPAARNEMRPDLYHGVYWMRPWEKAPFVLTVHDISFAVHPEWFRPGEARFYTSLIKLAARKARKVITVSEFCRGEIAGRWNLPADRIALTREAPRSIFAADSNQPRDPFTVLFVSAIHPRKNLGRLIRVLSRLRRERFPDLKLRVIGPMGWSAGPDLQSLREAVAEGHTEWSGARSDSELVNAYRTCTLLAYPSLYEGFGLPPLEAMACGCPVVCSNTSALPEVCGTAAEYFDPTSEEEMATKIGSLLENEPARKQLGLAGIAKAAEYSWREMAAATADIYRQAVH